MLVGFVAKQFVTSEVFGWKSIGEFFLLLISYVATTLIASKVLIEASSSHTYSMRLSLCKRILSTSFEHVEKVGKHRLVGMLSEDLNDIAVAYINIPTLIANATRLFFCILYLLWVKAAVVLIFAVCLMPIAYVQLLLFRNSKVHSRKILPIRDKRYKLYNLLINGQKEFLLDGRGRRRFFSEKLNRNARQFKYAVRKSFMANEYASNWGQSVYFIGIFALILVASKGYIEQEVVAAFALVGLFVRSSVISLVRAIPLWMRATVAVEKINSLSLDEINRELFLESKDTMTEMVSEDTVLVLENIVYTYVNTSQLEEVTIGPFSLSFKSGEIVFVAGGNGSGKTTFMKLATSMYKPVEGVIYLNDQRLSDSNIEWYRTHVHGVFSEFVLHGTVGEYISTYVAKKDRVSMLKKFRLPELLKDESLDLESSELSSGQKARLALVPVLFSDKPIVIFDEWAAHQDPEYKWVFYHELLPNLKRRNKVVIVITHDDRYFDIADRVIYFESGKVVR